MLTMHRPGTRMHGQVCPRSCLNLLALHGVTGRETMHPCQTSVPLTRVWRFNLSNLRAIGDLVTRGRARLDGRLHGRDVESVSGLSNANCEVSPSPCLRETLSTYLVEQVLKVASAINRGELFSQTRLLPVPHYQALQPKAAGRPLAGRAGEQTLRTLRTLTASRGQSLRKPRKPHRGLRPFIPLDRAHAVEDARLPLAGLTIQA